MQFSGKTQSTLVDHIVQDHRDITCACYWGLGSHILLTGPQAHDDQQGVDSQTDCSNHFLDLRHRSYSDSTTVAQQICGVGSPTNLTLAQTSCLETNCKRLHTGYSGHWGLGSHYTLTGLPEYSFHAGIRNCAEFYIGVGSLIFDSLAPFLDTQQLSNNTFASEEHQFSGVGSLLFDSLAQFLHSAQPHFWLLLTSTPNIVWNTPWSFQSNSQYWTFCTTHFSLGTPATGDWAPFIHCLACWRTYGPRDPTIALCRQVTTILPDCSTGRTALETYPG